MDINRANIEALFQDFQVAYTDGFNTGQERSILDDIAMVVPSTTAATRHAWLNQLPKMREWIGDRLVNNIESNAMTIENKKYEATEEMERTEIEDDQHGLYRPLAGLMGQGAATYPDELIANELVNDVDWLADGSAFFGTTRKYGSNTISNKSTTTFSSTEFEAARVLMTSYQGHSDEPLNVRPTFLLHGPNTKGTAFDVLENEFRAAGSAMIKNRNFGLAKPIESSRLVGTAANYVFLFGEIAGIKGAVYQERKKAEFQGSRLRDDSDFVFETDKYQFGARARGRAFLALPHLIFAWYVTA